jgi:O-antigen ligase
MNRFRQAGRGAALPVGFPRVAPSHWGAVVFGATLGILMLAGALRSPLLGVGLLVGVFTGVLVLSYPAVGMTMLTFLIPLERLQRFTSDTATFTISVMRIVALMCLAALILHRIFQKRPLRLDWSMFLYGGYVVLALAGILHTSDPDGTKRAIGTILANCLFFFLFLNYFERPSQIRFMILIWLAASLLGEAYSVYDWHFGSGRTGGIVMQIDPGYGAQSAANRWSTVWQDRAEWETLGGLSVRRSMGPTSHAAVYGINMIMTIPFFFYLMSRYRKFWQQALLILCLALTGYSILLTNTRAVILMAAGTVLVSLWYGLFKLRKGHMFALVLGFLIILPFIPRDIYNRVLDPKNYSSERSAAMRVRFAYWKAGLTIFQEHFLLGVGVGNSKVVPEYTRLLSAEETTVHNIYLQTALECGIIGWLCFFGFVAVIFHAARQAARWLRDRAEWREEHQILTAIQVAMIAVLIFGLQVDVFEFPLKGWWLMATIAIVLHGWARSLRRQSRPGEVAAPGNLSFAPAT